MYNMAKIVKPLTDTQIKNAKPKENDYTLSCSVKKPSPLKNVACHFLDGCNMPFVF
jgi:hypothetical protein